MQHVCRGMLARGMLGGPGGRAMGGRSMGGLEQTVLDLWAEDRQLQRKVGIGCVPLARRRMLGV